MNFGHHNDLVQTWLLSCVLVGLWFGKEGREQKPFVVLIHHSHHFCLCSLILQSASLSASTSASSLSSFPLKLANTSKGRSQAPGSSSRRQRQWWVGSALPWWQAPASSSWRRRGPWYCEVSPPSEPPACSRWCGWPAAPFCQGWLVKINQWL